MDKENSSRRYSREETLEMIRRERAKDAQELELAKESAIAAGKERFDLDRFDELYHSPIKSERLRPREERLRGWEIQYYERRGRHVSTMEEFAEHMRYNDTHWD